MTISRDEIKKTAGLARLGLGEDELDQFAADLTRIAAYFQQLREAAVDNSSVEPVSQAVTVAPAVEGVAALREDTIGSSLTPDEATGQAPHAAGGFFCVPKVIG